MADCVCFGLIAGLDNYTTKDGKVGCNLQVRVSSGKLYPFLYRSHLNDTNFPFGTPVTVHFDITFFNNRPGMLIASDIELSKKEGK